MFETGLAVARSLGRAGISVRGLDFRPDVGFRSRYVYASLCPHPLSEEDAFVDHLVQLAKGEQDRPVLFVTSDDFLLAVSRSRERLREFFLWNLL
jgi:predicted ATP-grasp superfamily ATP-dependent carboligase